MFFFCCKVSGVCLCVCVCLCICLCHCLLHCNLDNCDIGVRLTPDYRGLPRAKGRLLENSSHLTFSLWGEILKTDLTSSQMDFLSPAKSRGWREGAKKLATYFLLENSKQVKLAIYHVTLILCITDHVIIILDIR